MTQGNLAGKVKAVGAWNPNSQFRAQNLGNASQDRYAMQNTNMNIVV